MVYCLCGCGIEFPELDIRGRKRRFVRGHSSHLRRAPIGQRRVRDHGYIEIKTQSGFRREHRVVMEQSLGRPLKREEKVHHKNGDRTDNRIENLGIIANSEHSRLHGQLKRDKLRLDLRRCSECGGTTRWNKWRFDWIRSKITGKWLCHKCSTKMYYRIKRLKTRN